MKQLIFPLLVLLSTSNSFGEIPNDGAAIYDHASKSILIQGPTAETLFKAFAVNGGRVKGTSDRKSVVTSSMACLHTSEMDSGDPGEAPTRSDFYKCGAKLTSGGRMKADLSIFD